MNIDQYKPYSLNINDFIYDTLERVGKEPFFIYDPFAKNCQFFIRHLLKSHNLFNDRIEEWLFQKLSNIVKRLPWFSKWFAKSLTDVDAWRKIKFGGNKQSNDKELELISNMVYKMLK